MFGIRTFRMSSNVTWGCGKSNKLANVKGAIHTSLSNALNNDNSYNIHHCTRRSVRGTVLRAATTLTAGER